jgi:hypothetical protein
MLVDQIQAREGNSVEGIVLRKVVVQNSEFANDLGLPIGEHGVMQALPPGKIPKQLRAVIGERSDFHALLPVSFLLLAQLDELALAERSPIGGADEQ